MVNQNLASKSLPYIQCIRYCTTLCRLHRLDGLNFSLMNSRSKITTRVTSRVETAPLLVK